MSIEIKKYFAENWTPAVTLVTVSREGTPK